MQTFRVILVVLIVALAAGSASADVTLPAVFSDHMVLQHGKRVRRSRSRLPAGPHPEERPATGAGKSGSNHSRPADRTL
jgi:hypothetical protein